MHTPAEPRAFRPATAESGRDPDCLLEGDGFEPSVPREGPSPVRRCGSGEEPLDPRTFVPDAEVQSRGGRRPDDFAEPQSGGPPIELDQATRMIPPQPSGKVVELNAV